MSFLDFMPLNWSRLENTEYLKLALVMNRKIVPLSILNLNGSQTVSVS